jgi:tRNA-modifying protein YgfZ
MVLLLDETAKVRRDAGVVRVTGGDRLTYLHTLLSQQLEQVQPGTVADFLHLDAKGNPMAEGRAVVRAGEVWLVTPAEVAADLAAALEKFKFLMDVQAVDVSDRYAVVSVRGPGWVDAPGAREERMTAAPHGDGVVVRDRSGGVDLVGVGAWVEDKAAALDLPWAGEEDWQAWRISAGVPAWGSEIAGGRRPQELGLLPTHVHLRKGCYPGQESIAKTWNLGRPRRALAVIEVADRVEPGAVVEIGGKQGQVTSAAPAGAAWTALALLPVGRDGQLPGDGTLSAGGRDGRVRHRVGEGLPQPGA